VSQQNISPFSELVTMKWQSCPEAALAMHLTGAVWPTSMCLGVTLQPSAGEVSTSQSRTCPSLPPVTRVRWSRRRYSAEMQCVGAWGPHSTMGTTRLEEDGIFSSSPGVAVRPDAFLALLLHLLPRRQQTYNRVLVCLSVCCERIESPLRSHMTRDGDQDSTTRAAEKAAFVGRKQAASGPPLRGGNWREELAILDALRDCLLLLLLLLYSCFCLLC
jgi:hypothetical protein